MRVMKMWVVKGKGSPPLARCNSHVEGVVAADSFEKASTVAQHALQEMHPDFRTIQVISVEYIEGRSVWIPDE